MRVSIAFSVLAVFAATDGILQAACAPYPSGYIPFSTINYVTQPNTAGEGLVVGSLPMPTGLNNIAVQIALPSEPNQLFCGASIEMAPGKSYERVYVPTAAERAGDYSGFSGLLLDPMTNQPFPGGIIPASRLGGVYAWRISAASGSAIPVIFSGGIISASNDVAITLGAPGALMTIYGSNLATSWASATYDSNRQIPVQLAGASVKIGGRSAPLLYADPAQINFQVPFDTPTGTQPVVVETAGGVSAAVNLTIARAAPSIFVGAVVRYPDYSPVTNSNPGKPGDILIIYCTGLGAVTPAVMSGRESPSDPLSKTIITPRVLVDGEPIDVIYSVLSPGMSACTRLRSQYRRGQRAVIIHWCSVPAGADHLPIPFRYPVDLCRLVLARSSLRETVK